MDEKGSKQVDVLDVQPAAAAREQIAISRVGEKVAKIAKPTRSTQ
jgi:hypothetical protein